MESTSRLEHFHISFFAITLGWVGYSLALQRAEHVLNLPSVFMPVLGISIFLILSFGLLYALKALRFPKRVFEEFQHPVKINFFPIWAKLALILSIIFLEMHEPTARWLWLVGVTLQLFFSVAIVSVWIHDSKLETHHLNPAWFIPIVGNVIAPIAGFKLGYIELSWFFFSIGLIMWFVLFVLVFNRMLFHKTIPNRLLPSLFILFAPPSIAFISYTKMVGALDPFGRILFYLSLFLLLLVMGQIKVLRKLQFYLSWWAYSFPMVAVTVAVMLMYHMTKLPFYSTLSYIMLVALTLIMVMLSVKTLKAVFTHSLCNEE
jgi:tellurite resistance protein